MNQVNAQKAAEQDQQVVQAARGFAQDLCQQVPELRSVMVVLDWQDGRNQHPDHSPFTWARSDGLVRPTDTGTIVGGMEQAVKLLQAQSQLSERAVHTITRTLEDFSRRLQQGGTDETQSTATQPPQEK